MTPSGSARATNGLVLDVLKRHYGPDVGAMAVADLIAGIWRVLPEVTPGSQIDKALRSVLHRPKAFRVWLKRHPESLQAEPADCVVLPMPTARLPLVTRTQALADARRIASDTGEAATVLRLCAEIGI